MIFPGSVWSLPERSRRPLRADILGPLVPWEGDWKGASLAVDLQVSRDSRDTHPSLGLSSTSQELSVEDCQPPGLWAAQWGGSVAGFSGQPAKQQEAPAWGDGPGSRTRREGGGSWGGSSAWPRLGFPQRLPTSRPACPGCGNGGQPGWPRGACMSQVPPRKFLRPSCPAQGAPPQMLFLRVRPEIPKLPCFATLWALFRTGWGACHSLASFTPTPAFPAQSQGVHHLAGCV